MTDLTTYDYDIFLATTTTTRRGRQDWPSALSKRRGRDDGLKSSFRPGTFGRVNPYPKIEKGLERSRKVGLIMSPDAMESAWVELERLVTTHIAISARDERLIPLYLRDCEIPALLRPILGLDFKDDVNLEASYQALLSVIKEEPLPRHSLTPSGNSAELSLLLSARGYKRCAALRLGKHCAAPRLGREL